MTDYDVYGIGNALVDTEYEVEDGFLADASLTKGVMTLIEEDHRVRLTGLLTNERGLTPTKQAGGGSAANTVVTVSQLGGRTFYSCKVASDAVGDFFVADIDAARVNTNLAHRREAGQTGQCISMVTPDAERTMATCLGVTQFLSTKELNPSALRKSKYLYIEGYLVSSPTGFEAACEAQRIARSAGVKVSLTLSDPAMVENYQGQYDLLLGQGVDLLFCNLDEARLLTGGRDEDECVAALKEVCGNFTVTLGKEGALTFDGEDVTRLAGVPTHAIDTTGAGDIYAGAFLYAICNNRPHAEAAALANRSASLLVSRFGARLTQEEVDESLR